MYSSTKMIIYLTSPCIIFIMSYHVTSSCDTVNHLTTSHNILHHLASYEITVHLLTSSYIGITGLAGQLCPARHSQRYPTGHSWSAVSGWGIACHAIDRLYEFYYVIPRGRWNKILGIFSKIAPQRFSTVFPIFVFAL